MMYIEIPDEVAMSSGLNIVEIEEFLVISLYVKKRMNGIQGGKILDVSEMEFHGLLEEYDECVNYSVERVFGEC